MKEYKTEFKLEVVKSFLAGEGGAKLLARQWSVPEEKIRTWVSHYRLHGIEPSVGSKGDSYDNALAETINGLYKTEVIHRQSWKSREAVEMATLRWVHWYNTKRLMEPLGDIPPAEAEANFYRQLAGQAMAA